MSGEKEEASLVCSVNPIDWQGAPNSSASRTFIKQAFGIDEWFEYIHPWQLLTDIDKAVDFNSCEQSFLYFYEFDHRDWRIIEELLYSFGFRSALRFTFEYVVRGAIVRIMPGSEHESVGGELYDDIVRKIDAIPGHLRSTVQVGGTRSKVQGFRGKEGDYGLRPRTRKAKGSWPSLMIEVGYSQTLELLGYDAEWWLLQSQGRTRFVILIKVGREPFSLRIECWQMRPSPLLGISEEWVPTCTQDFDINEAGEVTSPLGSKEL